MTYTPGPWLASVDAWGIPRVTSQSGIHICGGNHRSFVTDGDAALIAAAPMLLEAADDAVKAFRLLRVGMAHDPKAIEVIDAHVSELEYAIAKTEA